MNSINGARWWKVDFHIHTPASEDYAENEKNISPKDFILNVMQKKIDCIVVADHNCCNWIEKLQNTYEELREANENGFRPLYIFPGLEYGNASPNAHLLCIFDVNNKESRINQTIGKLDGKTISECITVVSSEGGIAIPAHVDDQVKGLYAKVSHEESLCNNLLNYYYKGELYAVEVIAEDYLFPQIFIDNKLKFSKVIGSDSHSLSTIGEKFTWAKMESPNINALRLALFDSDDGTIRCEIAEKNPNIINNRLYIESIKVINAQKARRSEPLNIKFSPWLNTIIGGRGSGKSAIINFLRIGTNQCEDMDTNTKREYDLFNKVPANRNDTGMLLNDTKIIIILQDGNEKYCLTFSKKTEAIVEEMLNNDVWVELSNSQATKKTFPLSIYNQKQVYNLTQDPNIILNMIDEMCDIPIKRQNINEKINEYVSIKTYIRKLKKDIEDKSQIIRDKKRNETQLEIAKQSGITQIAEEYSEMSKYNSNFDSLNTVLLGNENSINSFAETITEIDTEKYLLSNGLEHIYYPILFPSEIKKDY